MKINLNRIRIIIALVVLGAAGAAPFFYDSMKSLNADQQDNGASTASMIETYTKDKDDMKLTIGVLQTDQMKYKVFGANTKELEPFEYEYEIGSISKTFTASMLCKAIDNGLVEMNNPISEYLPLDSLSLDSETIYPTVLSLATHTSGYGEYPFDHSSLSEEELERIDKDFYKKKKNIYQGIKSSEILDKIEAHHLKDKTYGWEYSNFGIAALGVVLGEVNHTSFQLLAQDFIKNDLGLTKTRFGNGKGNLCNYWTWDDGDAYIATAGVVSTVTDMLKYGQMHLNVTPDYLVLSHKTYQTFEEEALSMGLGWIIDPETGYLWHNGGTSSYTSFLGIDKKHETAVVILSNYPEIDDTKDDGALDILGYTLLDRLGKGERDIL